MYSSNNDELQNIKISEYQTGSKRYKIKSFIIFAILILLFLGLITFIGKIGHDFFAVFIFLLIMIIPVIILLRNKLGSVLPKFLKNSLLEIDNEIENNQSELSYNINVYWYEIGMYSSCIGLIIGAMFIMNISRNNISDSFTFVRIIGTMLLIIVAVVILEKVSGGESLIQVIKTDDEDANEDTNEDTD